MARYIDADELTKILLKEANKLIDDRDNFPIDYGVRSGYFSAISLIEWTETADVVPRSEVEKAKQEVARKLIAEFKDLVLSYVQDKDLLLVAFKNAVNYAETELKKKYIGG